MQIIRICGLNNAKGDVSKSATPHQVGRRSLAKIGRSVTWTNERVPTDIGPIYEAQLSSNLTLAFSTCLHSYFGLSFNGNPFSDLNCHEDDIRDIGAGLYDSWKERWVQSKHKEDYGDLVLSHGKFYGDETRDQGLKTSQDAKFYATSAKFPKPFSNKGKSVVIQLTVKHEQNIDCGGGYVKVMASDINQEDFHGDTPYNVMFGPDICGPGTKKVHVIFNYKGKNHLIKKDIRCKDDELTHLYTLILNPDNTYEVQIDGEKVESGSLEADWDLLPAQKIKDPDAKKPEDWEDKEYIDDADDKKPEDWDKPEHIPDPEAKKPEDWDDEMDGEWEAPMIDNPEYKGEWKPKQVKNPNYKGKWIHPEIDNPEYAADDEIYLYNDWGAIGIDIWQVKAGTIFDNVLVTDSVDDAKAHAAETFEPLRQAEKEQKEKHDEEDISSCFDVVIVGGGIIGCATARQLKLLRPSLSVALIEKESEIAKHQSGHNSGVLHAGIYYQPGSLKAKLCVEGIDLAYDYLQQNKIPFKKCGKLVVATEAEEIPKLETLFARAKQNGCKEIEMVGSSQITELEPHCRGLRAIWSPYTGVVDWGLVTKHFAEDFKKSGGEIIFHRPLQSIKSSSGKPGYAIKLESDTAQVLIEFFL
ncbi:calreticulin family domain-containing protein [Ditylenchus destructor]|nr:calreticulin family domain-containing protein [Ditylenchus destructor]